MQQNASQQGNSKPPSAVSVAQQIAAATRRAEVRKQQDREILRQIQR
jgi:hypothetical protein